MGVSISLDCELGMFQNHLAFLENEEGRYASDAEFAGGLLFRIYIDLAHFQPAVIFLRQFFHNGRHHLAGTAPRSPEIDQYGQGGVNHLGFERSVRQGYGSSHLGHHLSYAVSESTNGHRGLLCSPGPSSGGRRTCHTARQLFAATKPTNFHLRCQGRRLRSRAVLVPEQMR